ncbi:unnamed protein product, partial [Laminaria digitata]
MKAELAPSANEDVSLEVTTTAARSPLAEDTLTVPPGEIPLAIDKDASNGTETAAADEEIGAQQPVGETTEDEHLEELTPEVAKVEDASDFAGEGTEKSVMKNSAPTADFDVATSEKPTGTTSTQPEAILVAEQHETLNNTRSSAAETAAACAVTVDEAVKTSSPDEGMAEVTDEGELPQRTAITGGEDIPAATMEQIDTASVGTDKEISVDGAGTLIRSVDEGAAEEAAGEERAAVLAATGTDHLSSRMNE